MSASSIHALLATLQAQLGSLPRSKTRGHVSSLLFECSRLPVNDAHKRILGLSTSELSGFELSGGLDGTVNAFVTQVRRVLSSDLNQDDLQSLWGVTKHVRDCVRVALTPVDALLPVTADPTDKTRRYPKRELPDSSGRQSQPIVSLEAARPPGSVLVPIPRPRPQLPSAKRVDLKSPDSFVARLSNSSEYGPVKHIPSFVDGFDCRVRPPPSTPYIPSPEIAEPYLQDWYRPKLPTPPPSIDPPTLEPLRPMAYLPYELTFEEEEDDIVATETLADGTVARVITPKVLAFFMRNSSLIDENFFTVASLPTPPTPLRRSSPAVPASPARSVSSGLTYLDPEPEEGASSVATDQGEQTLVDGGGPNSKVPDASSMEAEVISDSEEERDPKRRRLRSPDRVCIDTSKAPRDLKRPNSRARIPFSPSKRYRQFDTDTDLVSESSGGHALSHLAGPASSSFLFFEDDVITHG